MTFLHFLSSLPTALMTFLVIAFYLVFTFITFLGCNKFIISKHRDDHTNLITTISQTVSMLYGLLLASIVVLIITNRMDISHAIETESTCAADIALLSTLLPEKSVGIQETLKNYLHTVKNLELPALKKGKITYEAGYHLLTLQKKLLSYATPTPNETMVIQKTLDILSDLYKSRRTRIEGAQISTHPYVWVVLIIGSFILIFCCALFSFRHTSLYLLILSLVGISVGLIISLMVAFDKPFAGDLAIQPIALNDSIKLLDELSSNVPLKNTCF